jgi:hypothetical protein
MHQIDNAPEQRWRDRRYEHALRAKHLDSFREPGSGWILVGTLVLLVLTGVAALFVYLWVSFDLFGDTTHPLEDYWGVALLAWVLTVLGALWLWAHPLPGRLNYVQLLVPVILFGIWCSLAFSLDTRTTEGGTVCFITACSSSGQATDPVARRSLSVTPKTYEAPTVLVTIGEDAIASDRTELEPGRQVLGIRNDSGQAVRIAIIFTSVPPDSASGTFTGALADPRVNSSVCALAPCLLHTIILVPGQFTTRAIRCEPNAMKAWPIVCDRGVYAVVALSNDPTGDGLMIDPTVAQAVLQFTPSPRLDARLSSAAIRPY